MMTRQWWLPVLVLVCAVLAASCGGVPAAQPTAPNLLPLRWLPPRRLRLRSPHLRLRKLPQLPQVETW